MQAYDLSALAVAGGLAILGLIMIFRGLWKWRSFGQSYVGTMALLLAGIIGTGTCNYKITAWILMALFVVMIVCLFMFADFICTPKKKVN